MNTKTFAIATIVGGISFFIVSFIFYGFILEDFFANNTGSATGVMKDPPNFAFLCLGELTFGALYAYIFLQWARISSFGSGMKGGAVIGFLLGMGVNMVNYGVLNLSNLTGAIGDIVVSTISGAIVGGIIAWVIGKVS